MPDITRRLAYPGPHMPPRQFRDAIQFNYRIDFAPQSPLAALTQCDRRTDYFSKHSPQLCCPCSLTPCSSLGYITMAPHAQEETSSSSLGTERRNYTLAEKEKFFADLARLDDLDSDSDDIEVDIGPGVREKVNKDHNVKQKGKDREEEVLKRKREEVKKKRTSTPPKNERRPPFRPARTSDRTNILPEAEDTTEPTSLSSPVRHLDATDDPPRPSTSGVAAPRPPPAPTLRRTQTEKPTARLKAGKGKKSREIFVPENDRTLLGGLSFFFIPNSDSNPVQAAQIQHAVARGAIWARSWDEQVTHIIICSDLHIERASREFKNAQLPEGIPVVKINWLVESMRFKVVQDPQRSRFCVPGMKSPFALEQSNASENVDGPQKSDASAGVKSTPTSRTHNRSVQAKLHSKESKAKDPNIVLDNLDAAISAIQKVGDLPKSLLEDNESQSESDDSFSATGRPPENAGFQCMEMHDDDYESPNARTIALLQDMANYYYQTGVPWKPYAYRRAISTLRKQKDLIRTKTEARALPFVGDRLAAKIEEIVVTDRLQRLDSARNDPTDQVLCLFMGIYGAGFAQAQKWIAQGFRSLTDLSEHANLTANQRVGIDHYEDFKQRIPREEVAQHAAVVKIALHAADRGLEMTVGGSFRRGIKDSGDIDIIITKKDAAIEHIRTLVMETVVPDLTKQGFLKAALATGHTRDSGSKWHGASALPGSTLWRRIDLLFVPWTELGAALIYFTGNDIFNRSMRLLAGRKGMRLNQHGLFKDVMRGKGRVRVTEGQLVEGQSERKIFELLGVPFHPPEYRKC